MPNFVTSFMEKMVKDFLAILLTIVAEITVEDDAVGIPTGTPDTTNVSIPLFSLPFDVIYEISGFLDYKVIPFLILLTCEGYTAVMFCKQNS